MFLTAAVAAIVCQIGTASDYFPLEPGTKKVYEQTQGKMVSRQTDTVGKPVEIEGQILTPIVTEANGQKIGTTYYLVNGDTVNSVGVVSRVVDKVPKDICLPPVAILKVGDKRMEWYSRELVNWFGKEYPQHLKATANYKGKRKLFGKDVDVIEVKYDITLGEGVGVADVRSTMTALYARGIGLIEQKDESIVSKVKTKQTLKLVEFTPASSTPK